ncbi:MAG TPA: acetamidase/formamidase family protein [Bryobacteraceae bacterium]|nr:acetamidase/formamidase family protein [Bryobacteraceae bacterium]
MKSSIISAGLLLTSVCLAVFAQTPSVGGRWIVTQDFFGTPRYMRLQLEQNGSRLSGQLNGDKLEGTVSGSTIHFVAHNENKDTFEVQGAFAEGILTGTMIATDATNRDHPYTFSLTAKAAPPLEHRAPQRHDFTPTVFYRQFSALNKPVLTVAPGDTIHTTTVDAGGTDEHNIRRVAGGNPETGPFYIEGAMPGDLLVVHINKLRLNRDWAASDDSLVDRGLNSDLAIKMKGVGKPIRWRLDLAGGTASPETPGEHLAHFSIPLKPMLGCIAAAPSISGAAPGTGDSGFYGGNMDFNEVGEGATVYLRISNPGALLYFGDGHAAEGDGEMNGNALETSMDVEIMVDVIPNKRIGDPRVETADAIITMGLDGSLDDAFKEATSDMAAWLAEDYKLAPSEIAQVIGAAAEYRVSEAADRNAGIVLKLKKRYLQPLAPAAR